MSVYRNAIWFVKGMKEYTRSGYNSASKLFNPADMQNITIDGKSYMITGANSGIGKDMALTIAKLGGVVHMVCRSKERGEQAKNEIVQQSGNQNVILHIVDLSQPVDVYKFATAFSARQEQLDVLVNNAGCMVHERKVDNLGFETNFATNTLAVHILTKTLQPLLEQSREPRVVNVSSGGMLTQKLDISDLQSEKLKKFDGTLLYAQQKRQQVIMTDQYSRMYPGIKFSAMHPGWADTPAVRSAMPDFYEKMRSRLRTPEEGADTAVWLALSPAALVCGSGKFFQDRQAVPTHLPLAWTHSSSAEENALMSTLDSMLEKVKAAALGSSHSE